MKEKFTSSTQYGDIKGNVTIDGHGNPNLHDFAEKYGIDTKKYFPIAIDIYRGISHESIYIIAVETDLFGSGTNYSNIPDYLQNDTDAFVKKIELKDATIEDYLKECKRFNLVASSIPELINLEIDIRA